MAIRLFGLALIVATAVFRVSAQPDAGTMPGVVWSDALDGATASPDGKLIAFVDWNVGDVSVRDVATGVHRRLGDSSSSGFPEPYFAFSPKSDALVFPFGNDGAGSPFAYELRRIDLATGVHDVLASFPPDVSLIVPLAWHGDAGLLFNTIAADASSALMLLDPLTKSTRVLQRRRAGDRHAWQASFTGDGKSVVVLANDAIEWINVSDGISRPLGVPAEILFGWSADERALLFHGSRNGVVGNWSIAVSQGRISGRPVLLQRTAPGVRSAGRSVRGMHYLEPAQLPSLYQATFDPLTGALRSGPQPILPTPGFAPGHPVWSKDGSRLAFARAISNRNENRIFVAEGASGPPREIGGVDLRVTGLDWSANGRFLVVGGRAMSRDTSWIGRINVSTGAIEKFATGAPASAAAAGVGDQIVFTRTALAGSGDVHVMHVSGPGTSSRVLATYPLGELPRSLSVSPDGSAVAVLKPIPNRRTGVVLLPIDGGAPRIVLELQRPDFVELNQGSICWTADGRHLFVLARRAGKRELLKVAIATGEITLLPVVPKDGGRNHIAVHPDRGQIVYVDGVFRDEMKILPEPRAR